MAVAILALGCSDALAQTRARAAAVASIQLIQPGGLRSAAVADAAGPIVETSEPPGASYQLVTPERIVSGVLVIETADRLRRAEGPARLPIGVTLQLPAGSGGATGVLPVIAVFD